MLKITKEKFNELIPERDKWLIPDPADFDAYVEHVGNFTVVLIVGKNFYAWAVGVSKRNPCDKDSFDIGISIAAIRALKTFRGKDPGYSRQRPVSKKDAKVASNVAFAEKLIDEARRDFDQ